MAQLHVPVTNLDYAQGEKDAPMTLVEYGDYECPACALAYPVVKELQAALGDTLRFVFRNFPLRNVHPHAQRAAEAAEIAGEQGVFWEMHDALFENQDALEDDHLREYAHGLGIEREDFVNALISHRCAEKVVADFESGVRSGVNATPTFFINGVRHDGDASFGTLLVALSA